MAAYNNEIHNVGDELVLWAPSHPGAVGDIKKHNGEVVRISKVVAVPKPNASGSMVKQIYYECEDIVSNKGVPFGILPEWLARMGGDYQWLK